VAGIVSGGACHVAVAATGVAVLLRLLPAAFTTLLWAGALYVAWIGLSLFRGGAVFSAAPPEGQRAAWATFRRGALTNLLNPKAYLFMLAVFPQFLRPEYGPTWLQALVLWGICALTQLAVYGAVALIGDQARGWLEASPKASTAVGRTLGALMMLVAVLTVLKA
jgi:threonine/homoserine/homoserine lactone efflux protein